MAVIHFGPFTARQLQNCRREINEVAWILPELAPGMDAFRPMNDQRRADSALMHPGFVQAKGCICRASPGRTDRKKSFGRTGSSAGLVTVAPDDLFGAGAIVRHKEDDGVFKVSCRFELLENVADFEVRAMNHRGMKRHLDRLELFLLGT